MENSLSLAPDGSTASLLHTNTVVMAHVSPDPTSGPKIVLGPDVAIDALSIAIILS
jgi:hypothetical protein